MTPVRRAWLLVVAIVLAIGCGATPDPVVPVPLPSPLRVARTVPQADGSIRIEAVSAAAVPNQPYLYPAFTHCGFTANTFDFDRSFWSIVDAPAAFAAENGNPPTGIDNPVDNGVIALTGPDRAMWISRLGVRLSLARGPSEVRVFGCD